MGLRELSARLETVVAIPVTPFDGLGAVDLAAFAGLVTRMVARGVRAITPNGGTSEFYSLSEEERDRLLGAAVSAARGQALVVPGVGLDIATAIGSAGRARQLGADAVMIHPLVQPGRSEEGWIAYHRAIAGALPDLGFVLYIRDASVGAEAIARLVEAAPNIVAIKYGVADPLRFADVAGAVGRDRVTWLCGLAELWAPFFWIAGARGFTSGLANVHPELSLELFRELRGEDYHRAMKVWQRVRPFEALRARHAEANSVPVVKEALALLGVCGHAVRPPLSRLAEEEREELRAILAGWQVPAAPGARGGT